jgi:hypothetical protein
MKKQQALTARRLITFSLTSTVFLLSSSLRAESSRSRDQWVYTGRFGAANTEFLDQGSTPLGGL